MRKALIALFVLATTVFAQDDCEVLTSDIDCLEIYPFLDSCVVEVNYDICADQELSCVAIVNQTANYLNTTCDCMIGEDGSSDCDYLLAEYAFNSTNATCEVAFEEPCFEDEEEMYFWMSYGVDNCTVNKTYNACDAYYNETSCNASVSLVNGTNLTCDCYYQDNGTHTHCEELQDDLLREFNGTNYTNGTNHTNGNNSTNGTCEVSYNENCFETMEEQMFYMDLGVENCWVNNTFNQCHPYMNDTACRANVTFMNGTSTTCDCYYMNDGYNTECDHLQALIENGTFANNNSSNSSNSTNNTDHGGNNTDHGNNTDQTGCKRTMMEDCTEDVKEFLPDATCTYEEYIDLCTGAYEGCMAHIHHDGQDHYCDCEDEAEQCYALVEDIIETGESDCLQIRDESCTDFIEMEGNDWCHYTETHDYCEDEVIECTATWNHHDEEITCDCSDDSDDCEDKIAERNGTLRYECIEVYQIPVSNNCMEYVYISGVSLCQTYEHYDSCHGHQTDCTARVVVDGEEMTCDCTNYENETTECDLMQDEIQSKRHQHDHLWDETEDNKVLWALSHYDETVYTLYDKLSEGVADEEETTPLEEWLEDVIDDGSEANDFAKAIVKDTQEMFDAFHVDMDLDPLAHAIDHAENTTEFMEMIQGFEEWTMEDEEQELDKSHYPVHTHETNWSPHEVVGDISDTVNDGADFVMDTASDGAGFLMDTVNGLLDMWNW